MNAWQLLYSDIQLTDKQISTMNVSVTAGAFRKAEELGQLEEFTVLYWDAIERLHTISASPTKYINKLEALKRYVGRRYNASMQRGNTDMAEVYRQKYNELELKIQWLTEQYNVQRSTQKYFIK